jgi:uncharacterized protein
VRALRSWAALAAAAFLLVVPSALRAGAPLPPKPAHYFNDYASIVPAYDGERLDAKLRTFDEETGHQVVVAIFRELPPGEAIEDFTVRTAESWHLGRKKEDDGAALFVFVQNRKTRLEVGYGLEGQIPDITAKHIVQDVLAPHFREQRYAAGLEAAVNAILAAARGDAAPVATPDRFNGGPQIADFDRVQWGVLLITGVVMVIFILALRRGGPRGGGWSSGGWSSGSSDWSGGGWSDSGGGGGFSGGGGSFGGGGATGDW